jgi:hypothetical protein
MTFLSAGAYAIQLLVARAGPMVTIQWAVKRLRCAGSSRRRVLGKCNPAARLEIWVRVGCSCARAVARTVCVYCIPSCSASWRRRNSPAPQWQLHFPDWLAGPELVSVCMCVCGCVRDRGTVLERRFNASLVDRMLSYAICCYSYSVSPPPIECVQVARR